MMYRQRPAGPALVAAACVLVFGTVVIYWLRQRVDIGEANESSVLFAGCLTCGIAGSLVILAFARYQFLHLWVKKDPAFAKKTKRQRQTQRRRS